MSIREYLQITPEVTPGTYAGGTGVLIDLDTANAYTVNKKPVQGIIRTAGGFNRRGYMFSKKYGLAGNLNVLPHGSQMATLMAWAVATSGNVLSTCTVDHVFLNESGTLIYTRDLGMAVQQATIAAQESDQKLTVGLQLIGMSQAAITGGGFAAPSWSSFPNDPIYTLEDSSAGLTLHSETRVDYEMFNLTIKNYLDPRFFVAATVQKIKYCGRDVTLKMRLSDLTAVPRTDFNATTAIAASIEFSNGTDTCTFALQSTNYYSEVTDDLDFSKTYLQNITLEAFLDPSVPDDLVVTCT